MESATMYNAAEELYFHLAHEFPTSHVIWESSLPQVMKIEIKEMNADVNTTKHLEYIWQKGQWILAQQI
jgi:hypothetical protein